jgi:hypothetical protein
MTSWPWIAAEEAALEKAERECAAARARAMRLEQVNAVEARKDQFRLGRRVETLRAAQRRKPTLIAHLDKARSPRRVNRRPPVGDISLKTQAEQTMGMQMPDCQPSYFEFLMKNRGLRVARVPFVQATGVLPTLAATVRVTRASAWRAANAASSCPVAPPGWSPRPSAVIDQPKLWPS